MAGLAPFYSGWSDPATLTMAAIGDSTTEGTVSVTAGGWTAQLRLLSATRLGYSGTGFNGLHRDEWNLTSGAAAWTIATSADTWDVGPMRGSQGNPKAAVYKANGSTRIATWLKPFLSENPTAFTIYAVDGAGAGDFSYSLDVGATWTDVSGVTWTAGNGIKRISIRRTITGSDIQIRAANAAGTGVNTYLMGIDTKVVNPGWTVHNLGANSEFLFETVRTTSGNWHAWLDLVQPPLVTCMFTNDIVFFDIAAWQTRWETLMSTVTGYGGSVLAMNFFEQAPTIRDISQQDQMRQVVKLVAKNYGMPYLDFYDLVGDYAATYAAGYYDSPSGDIHANDAGCLFMAKKIWGAIARSNVGAMFDTVGA